jgi:hypothetical protein
MEGRVHGRARAWKGACMEERVHGRAASQWLQRAACRAYAARFRYGPRTLAGCARACRRSLRRRRARRATAVSHECCRIYLQPDATQRRNDATTRCERCGRVAARLPSAMRRVRCICCLLHCRVLHVAYFRLQLSLACLRRWAWRPSSAAHSPSACPTVSCTCMVWSVARRLVVRCRPHPSYPRARVVRQRPCRAARVVALRAPRLSKQNKTANKQTQPSAKAARLAGCVASLHCMLHRRTRLVVMRVA